jgi:hypothetical protein
MFPDGLSETNKKPGKRNDERKIYKSEIASYYRWREVEKRHLSGETIENACGMASEALAPTDYKGSLETMRKAYQRVSRDLQQPAKAYHTLSLACLHACLQASWDILGDRVIMPKTTRK